MSEHQRIGAVITAAGMSSRMGDFKPMLQMGSISIIKRTIANFQQAGVFPVVVVTGYRAEELQKHISKLGVICIRNEEYGHTEMIDSARIGLEYIRDKCDRTFFTPVDVPLFTVNTVRRLTEFHAKIVQPVCGGLCGHPVLLSCDILPELLHYGKDGGLKEAMHRFASDTRYIEVGDEGILKDADTPEDYREMVAYHNRQLLRPAIDISLMREDTVFDKDGALLLHLIEYDGTVKEACKKIKISYSKAWNLISAYEANLGHALVERRPGGEAGGASRLTEKGKQLLDRYERFSSRVKSFADECFAECFQAEDEEKNSR